MKIIVFGATGGIGRKVVAEGKARGHALTAFVRDPAAANFGEGVELAQGDVFDPDSVQAGLAGHDAVIVALGSRSLSSTTVRSQGTANVIAGMKAEDISRLAVVSAMGVGESWGSLSWFNRLFFATLLRASRQDHEAQEAAVKSSGLRWTLLRPSGLSDDPARGAYELGETVRGKTARIPREDVARALLDALESDELVQRAVTITE